MVHFRSHGHVTTSPTLSPNRCHVACHAARFYALIDGEVIVGKCSCWVADTSSEGNSSVGSVIITVVGSVIITVVGSVIITLVGSVIITLIGSIIIPLSELGQNEKKKKAVPSHVTELTTPLTQRKNAQYVLLHL